MANKKLCMVPLLGVAVFVTSTIFSHDGKSGEVENSSVSDLLLARSKHWSYQPVVKPEAPIPKNAEWVNTSVDAFILDRLEKNGLLPSPQADKATLIRRLSLDVLGFIPHPSEVDAFINDDSPDAYEKLVERVLASPHYGERQARKWLDLARYADSAGFQNDNDRRNAWRYRDYVINAFNTDKPYSRFIQEQLAGDEMWPGDEEGLIATGFMAQYPDNSNSRDMIQRRYQIITDITDTVGQLILGQTVQCARCHDHKFDTITQKEYFSLQSFFANLNAVDNIPVTRKGTLELEYERAVKEWEDATRDIRDRIDEIIRSDYDAALEYYKTRFMDDTLAALRKPEDERNGVDRWIHHRFESTSSTGRLTAWFEDRATSVDPEFYSEWHAEKWAEIQALNRELRSFNHLRPTLDAGSAQISAMTELGYAEAPATFVLAGGDHERPLEEVLPAFPAAITSATPEIPSLPFSSGRRAALASWLTDADNPLTARVYVNRVWDQYFGRGIVESLSDFGKAGARPDHPELLDYLAARFVEQGWSIKALHREILLSNVYRQTSTEREDLLQADPQNRLLGVFPPQRLDAEQIRDSLLVAADLLEDKVGGSSVFPPLPRDGATGDSFYEGDSYWRESSDPSAHHRRSLYIFTRRSLPYPLLDVFNKASPQQMHSKRDITTTPLQALALSNSDLVYDWSRALAGRVLNESRSTERDPLDRLYEILFARLPAEQEKQVLTEFLQAQTDLISGEISNGKAEPATPSGLNRQSQDIAGEAAFVDLVHTVVNLNEFVYRL